MPMITEEHKKHKCFKCEHSIPYVEISYEAASGFSCRQNREPAVADMLNFCDNFLDKVPT